MKRVRAVKLVLTNGGDFWAAVAINENGNVVYTTAHPTAHRAFSALIRGAGLRAADFAPDLTRDVVREGQIVYHKRGRR